MLCPLDRQHLTLVRQHVVVSGFIVECGIRDARRHRNHAGCFVLLNGRNIPFISLGLVVMPDVNRPRVKRRVTFRPWNDEAHQDRDNHHRQQREKPRQQLRHPANVDAPAGLGRVLEQDEEERAQGDRQHEHVADEVRQHQPTQAAEEEAEEDRQHQPRHGHRGGDAEELVRLGGRDGQSLVVGRVRIVIERGHVAEVLVESRRIE